MFVKHPVFDDYRRVLIKGFNYLAIVKVLIEHFNEHYVSDFQHINVLYM